MRYDQTLLRSCGLLQDTVTGSIDLSGTPTPYIYDRTNRMFYVELDNRAPDQLFESFAQLSMFDYLWLGGRRPMLLRTFGERRLIGPEKIVGAETEQLSHTLLHHLFNTHHDMRRAERRLRTVRLALAQSVAASGLEVAPVAAAEDLIRRIVALLHLLRHGVVEYEGSASRRGAAALIDRLLDSGRSVAEAVVSLCGGESADLLTTLSPSAFTYASLIEWLFGEPPWPECSVPFDERSVRGLLRWLTQEVIAGDRLEAGILEFLHETYLSLPSAISVAEGPSSKVFENQRPNRRTGSYYTPEELAHEIVSTSLAKWLADQADVNVYDPTETESLNSSMRSRALRTLRGVRVLDPSAGAGVFLLAAADWLLRARRFLGDTRPEHTVRREIIESNIYGVDLLSSATNCSALRLRLWLLLGWPPSRPLPNLRLRLATGNSLIGAIRGRSKGHCFESSATPALDWDSVFPEVFSDGDGGFDIIVGNPPYGNITSPVERAVIRRTYPWETYGGREGTWNSASLFLVRSRMLLNDSGHLGLLLPNSILRVRQFSKTRAFLRRQLGLWGVTDVGSPFPHVTLEMVTLFASVRPRVRTETVSIRTRRHDLPQCHRVTRKRLDARDIMVLYHDDIFDRVYDAGRTGVLSASRGRDIPATHTRPNRSPGYDVPYAATGRSVSRYGFNESHLSFADDWFESDRLLRESYESRFLVSTKNLPFPRCALKPQGMLHGGGVVRIRVHSPRMNEAAIGLILNSELVRYICVRYLTNYSQLTTCLNTGIMNEIPVAYPDEDSAFQVLFHTLQLLHSSNGRAGSVVDSIETIANALVYELYLLDSSSLLDTVTQLGDEVRNPLSLQDVLGALVNEKTMGLAQEIMNNPVVERIRAAPRMGRFR
ncbi:MAG: Eco57I restriction-modification methylase domain-containing protein [Candidatus Thorarchaeota archaeon]